LRQIKPPPGNSGKAPRSRRGRERCKLAAVSNRVKTMRSGAMIAISAICAMAFAAPEARAQDSTDDQPKESLSQFLARCDADATECRNELIDGFDVAADDMAFICPPDDLTEDQAADTELQWLRNAAAANGTLADGDEVDAEYTALNTLWPCGQ
jgi:hypothetical protein